MHQVSFPPFFLHVFSISKKFELDFTRITARFQKLNTGLLCVCTYKYEICCTIGTAQFHKYAEWNGGTQLLSSHFVSQECKDYYGIIFYFWHKANALTFLISLFFIICLCSLFFRSLSHRKATGNQLRSLPVLVPNVARFVQNHIHQGRVGVSELPQLLQCATACTVYHLSLIHISEPTRPP